MPVEHVLDTLVVNVVVAADCCSVHQVVAVEVWCQHLHDVVVGWPEMTVVLVVNFVISCSVLLWFSSSL